MSASLRPTRDDVITLLGNLVAIDSVNPSLVPGAAGEERISRWVADWLGGAGIEAYTSDAAPGRPNVVGRVVGAAPGRALMLNAHVDTVGVAGMADPFEPRVEGDRLHGRGAYDMKGGLASILLAARALSGHPDFWGEVIVTGVADEEYASLGTQDIVRTMHADAAVVTEPTGLRICTAHKGFAWYAVETHGRAAHGSKPDLGVDAIARMGHVLMEMERMGAAIGTRAPHPLLGVGSVHASLIEGGQELSSYPEHCRLEIERRTVPGETQAGVTEEMETMLRAAGAQDERFQADLEFLLWRDPFEIEPEAPIVRMLHSAAAGVLGETPEIYGDTPWMDAALLSAAGIPTVVFGPGGVGAHAVTEWASIDEVARCAEILARTAIAFCGGTE